MNQPDTSWIVLVMNGIKYCRSSVSVVLNSIAGNMVRIAVMSDGTPIAEEERGKIFEPFYQSASTRSRLAINEGTGLGLSFARSLASLHNGTLNLDPDFREGNSFVVELPVGQLEENNEPEEDNSLMGEEQDTSKYTILIVEDDITLNDYIRTELSSEYSVLQAHNGKEALAILNEKSVSIIVSDIMMPEMDGRELLDVVKSTLRFSRSTLFRKIRANTGLNINEYIRVCRLKKAAELLSTQKYQAKEVAYMVGFTSLSYFTKSFQKQFNISPSSLLKKN